jgi:hypothetical protein
MAWIYLAESGESALPYRLGLEQLPTVKTTDTHSRSFCPECIKEVCTMHPFGMMCELSEWEYFLAASPSTSFVVDFHARTLVLQELEKAWQESEVGYSLKSQDWLASFDLDSFSWKMCQLSLFEGLTEFLWSSLRWGTTVAGRLYQPRNLEPRTFESDGFYLPTPTTVDGGSYFNKSKSEGAALRPTLGAMAKHSLWPTPMARDWKGAGGKNRNSIDLPKAVGGQLNPTWVEWLMGYPIDHTALSAWVIPWFRYKREKRSKD